MAAAILKVAELTKRFGGFEAVSGLSFDLAEGEILGLVGPNGAGKTTTFNLVSGFLRPTRGSVEFRGEPITHLDPPQIAARGLVRTFQLNKLFLHLTVAENIWIGCHRHEPGGLRRFLLRPPASERRRLEGKVEEIIDFVGLEALRGKRAADLAYGDQKLLGIGVALGTEPRLLMLDEPFAGMNPTEAARCARLIQAVLGRGTSVFLVDHNMRAIMGICDRVMVLNFGRKVAEGAPEIIQSDPQVIACYLGAADPC